MAPKPAEKAPAKAPAKKTTAADKKKKKVSKAETYKIYIYKCVLLLFELGRCCVQNVCVCLQGRGLLCCGA